MDNKVCHTWKTVYQNSEMMLKTQVNRIVTKKQSHKSNHCIKLNCDDQNTKLLQTDVLFPPL